MRLAFWPLTPNLAAPHTQERGKIWQEARRYSWRNPTRLWCEEEEDDDDDDADDEDETR